VQPTPNDASTSHHYTVRLILVPRSHIVHHRLLREWLTLLSTVAILALSRTLVATLFLFFQAKMLKRGENGGQSLSFLWLLCEIFFFQKNHRGVSPFRFFGKLNSLAFDVTVSLLVSTTHVVHPSMLEMK
jgi:hypothetical protein